MSEGSAILGQDEIDALLQGVDGSDLLMEENTDDTESAPNKVRTYDIASEIRIVSRMPTMEMINDRFARSLRTFLFKMLRRTPIIEVLPLKAKRFNEYTQTLYLPASLNIVKLSPLSGSALFVLDSRLVFTMVDNFFGGKGRYAKIEGREFTGTESRVIQMVLKQAFLDLQEAWSPVLDMQVEFLSSEMNPNFANIVSPSEAVLINSFAVELDGGSGEVHVVMPYTMIEPIRSTLESSMRTDQDTANKEWDQSVRDELADVKVEMAPILGQATMSLAQVLNLKAGDVIPCDFDGQVTLLTEGVPFVRGTLGASRGQMAVKVADRIQIRNRQSDVKSVGGVM